MALGTKFDDGKPRWSLMKWGALEDVVRVLTYGAAKYGDDNWRLVPNARDRYFSAAMRHLIAWQRGKLTDDETGLPHLAHAASCLLLMAEMDLRDALIGAQNP